MKTMKIITTVCWVITALAVAGLAIWFLTGTLYGIRIRGRDSGKPFDLNFNIGGWESLTGPYELVGSYNVGTSGIDSVNIDWIAGSIDVKPHDGNEIQINEYAQRQLKDEEKLYLNTSGSTLTVKFREHGFTGYMPQKRLEVLIPRSLCESLAGFALDSTSGGVHVDHINSDTFKVNTISGSIDLAGIVSRTFDAGSTSGSITIKDAHPEDMSINSISGSIRISDSGAKSLDIDSTSGSITVSGAYDSVKINSISGRQTLDNSAARSGLTADSTSGSLEFAGSFESAKLHSLSGSVNIRSTVVPSKVKVETTSGSITIAIPNDSSISVNHSSTSGRLSSDIPMTIQNGSAQFELSSTSGSVKIVAID